MAERDDRHTSRLDQPREIQRRRLPRPSYDAERFGRASERFARFMGTAAFLVYMTAFVVIWLLWNTFVPVSLQFDPRHLNYTLLTLILSLQASYAAPLILLAQNRQTDRDRVGLEQDRARDERNLADTEYLTREVAALRIALREVATRDFVRSELRSLLEEMAERDGAHPDRPDRPKRSDRPDKRSKTNPGRSASTKGPTGAVAVVPPGIGSDGKGSSPGSGTRVSGDTGGQPLAEAVAPPT